MKNLIKFLLFVVVLTLAFIGILNLGHKEKPDIAATITPQVKPATSYTPAEAPKLDLKDVELLSRLDQEYTRLIKAVRPSVVSINTRRNARVYQSNDPFELFFGGRRQYLERGQAAAGSGAIVSKEGYIVTNNHVIADMDEISVTLSDGRQFAAKIIGTDEETDIAVLKIDVGDLSPLTFGDSDQVEVGQMVFAVGNPFGLEESVTQGIISAIGRRTMSDSGNEFLQTDTAINPGNSGGPLINLHGEIVGINNHIFSKSGGYQGIAFAIPSNVAKRVLESVVRTGHVQRGYLGIMMQPLDANLAAQFGLSDSDGVIVAEVMPNSPADKAGLKRGDIIRQFNKHKITDPAQLRTQVGQINAGEIADITIYRQGREQALQATVGNADTSALTQNNMQSNPSAKPSQSTLPSVSSSLLRGVNVRAVTPQIIQQYGLASDTRGVQVVQVEPETPASQVLQPGDIIEEIAQQPVESAEDFQKISEKVDNSKPLLLFINRERMRSFVIITP